MEVISVILLITNTFFFLLQPISLTFWDAVHAFEYLLGRRLTNTAPVFSFLRKKKTTTHNSWRESQERKGMMNDKYAC